MTVVVTLFFFLFGFLPYNAVETRNVCPENFSCVPISDCFFGVGEGDVLYPCNHGKHICCPKEKTKNEQEKTTAKYEQQFYTSKPITDNEDSNEKNKDSVSKFDDIRLPESRNNSNTGELVYHKEEKDREEYLNANNTSGDEQGWKIDDTDQHVDSMTSSTETHFDQIRFNIPEYTVDDNVIPTSSKSTLDNKVKEKTTQIPPFEDSGEISKEKESNAIVRRRPPFKKNCGLSLADNKITGGQVAELGQFPWMALLGFRQNGVPNTQFLCGGSLITSRHILTAAHCIVENRPLKLVLVRLGEYNLTSSRDCVTFGKDEVCSDQPVDVPIERVSVHPQYNRKTLKNDIAIIKVGHEVRESDYIKTVCLPFDRDFANLDLTGQNFTVSGWGKSSSGNLFGSNLLQYAKVTTWNPRKCNNSVPPEVKPISSSQLCANGPNTEDACKGDSGGPLVNTTLDTDLEVRHIQLGIVSFGTATCGDHNLPTIYTRVDKYLQWIVENVT